MLAANSESASDISIGCGLGAEPPGTLSTVGNPELSVADFAAWAAAFFTPDAFGFPTCVAEQSVCGNRILGNSQGCNAGID